MLNSNRHCRCCVAGIGVVVHPTNRSSASSSSRLVLQQQQRRRQEKLQQPPALQRLLLVGILLSLSLVSLSTSYSITPVVTAFISTRASQQRHHHHHRRRSLSFVDAPTSPLTKSSSPSSSSSALLLANQKNDDIENWMDFPNDGTTSNNNNDNNSNANDKSNNNNDDTTNSDKKLGIEIGKMLNPMSNDEAIELKVAATEIINDAVAAGIDDISQLRNELQREIEQQSKQREIASQQAIQTAETQLLSKIDALTNEFLSSTSSSRTSTKLAAAADEASTGRGIELGSWGRVAGTGGDVVVDAAATTVQQEPSTSTAPPGIVVVADVVSDPYAKQLVDPLIQSLQTLFDPIPIPCTIYKPTTTVPLGGPNNAATIVVFCTSFNDPSSVNMILDRLLRKTIQPQQDGSNTIGQPPSHIVAISTLGTTRIEKVPYSFQNLMSGGKLSQRRQMEEMVIRVARGDPSRSSALDYTICNLGEIKTNDVKESFQFGAGDTVDGSSLELETAVTVVSQAICLQPTARNATLSCSGKLSMTGSPTMWQDVLDDAFLRLDGPELFRLENLLSSPATATVADTDNKYFVQVVEYIKEWAKMLAETGKGLTTPIRYEYNENYQLPLGVTQGAAVKILFLPTATGKNYVSKVDERKMSSENDKSGGGSSSRPVVKSLSTKEGGLEFVVEVVTATQDAAAAKKSLRVRVKRCNYGDDTVIVKEISEATILSSFRKAMDVWNKDR